MFCRQCGTQNEDNAKRCVRCGAELAPIPEQQPGQFSNQPPGQYPGQPSYQQPMTPPKGVPNHLVEAILVTIFCCLIPGIVAIVYSAQVNSKLLQGDYYGAVDSSNKAKTWSWVSFGLGLIWIIVYITVAVIGAKSGAGSSRHYY
ncbi:MAG: CD225/dispanin family protein [Armatimonadota bacterium]